MQTDWPPEHSQALRQYHARGMSYAQIAAAINARFGTGYSRSAAIGRGKRLGLAVPEGREKRPTPARKARLLQPPDPRLRDRHISKVLRPKPVLKSGMNVMTIKLRCVEIDPRHLSLTELECDDCRYPYGGDEEGRAITFCGHPRRHGSSYCTAHFHLTRGPGAASERAAGTVSLSLVKAA
jgi:GcrA cell cycle regulator